MFSLKAWSGKLTVTGICIISSICIKLVDILNLVLRKSEVKKKYLNFELIHLRKNMKNTFTLSINVRLKVTRALCILISRGID